MIIEQSFLNSLGLFVHCMGVFHWLLEPPQEALRHHPVLIAFVSPAELGRHLGCQQLAHRVDHSLLLSFTQLREDRQAQHLAAELFRYR